MIRQGQIALAQAQYRLGNFAEAVNLYETVLQESPPTLPLLRGLGLSLARLERYDEAFTHLALAHSSRLLGERAPYENHLRRADELAQAFADDGLTRWFTDERSKVADNGIRER